MKSVLYARVSDNVLDPEDWPVRRLIIEGDRIVDHAELAMEGYPLRSFGGGPEAGWTIAQLLTWSSKDYTGWHPEEFHDLKATNDRDYSYITTHEEMIELLRRGEV